MIFVIDDDEIMRECIARACGEVPVRSFSNAYEAMAALAEGENDTNDTNVAKKTGGSDKKASKLPDLIFLDILLDGPDGFTFLNELVSYSDTARIPVVVVSSLDFGRWELTEYGVVGTLDKATMTPQEIRGYVQKYCAK